MDPELYRAATTGDVQLLERVASLDMRLLLSKAPQENTALHIASRFGHAHFTRRILQLCSQLLGTKNSENDTALHCAVRAGCLKVVQILMDFESLTMMTDPDDVEEERGSSPSSLGGVLRMQNKEGDTALHEALRKRSEDMAIKMVRADPRLAFVVNNAKESPFVVAAKEEMVGVVKEILLGTDPSVRSTSDGRQQASDISNISSSITYCREKRELIRMQDNTGRTALHYAVWRNNARIVSMILTTDKHHVPYVRDNNGHTPLHVAGTFGMQCSMQELLERCPDSVEQLDLSGRNVLHIALLNQQNSIIRQLLKMPHVRGLLKELDNKEGNTPTHPSSVEDVPSSLFVDERGTDQLTRMNRHSLALHPAVIPTMDPNLYKAATSGDVGFLEQLIDSANFLLLSKAPQENTALHIAARLGHAHFIRKILQLCSQLLKIKNSNHDTALHCAARAGCLEIVQILLDFESTMTSDDADGGASSSIGLLRMQNKKGDTALHEALRKQSVDTAIKMLKADPKLAFVVNNANESSFLLAAKQEMKEVVKEILSINQSVNNSGEVQAAVAIKNTSADIVIPITALPQLTEGEKIELMRIQDNIGKTALHYAAWRNNAEIVHIILKTDSRHVPYIKDNNGHSPLHVAVTFGMQWSMLELLKHCPDTVEQFDTSGRNVIQLALLNRRFGIIQQLLELPHIGGLLDGPDQEENTSISPTSRKDNCTSIVGDSRAEPAAIRNEDRKILFVHDSVHRDQTQHIDRAIVATTPIKKADPKEDKDLKALQETKDEYQVFVVVASLIATVTFSAAFQLPGGYRGGDDPNPGIAILAGKPAFKAFLLLDTLAMFFSVSAISCYVWAWGRSASTKISTLDRYLTFGNTRTLISSICMLSALSAGVYVAVEHDSKGLAIAVLSICNLLPAVFLPVAIMVLLAFVLGI